MWVREREAERERERERERENRKGSLEREGYKRALRRGEGTTKEHSKGRASVEEIPDNGEME